MKGAKGKHPPENPGLRLVGPANGPAEEQPQIDERYVLGEAFRQASQKGRPSVEEAIELALFVVESWFNRTLTDGQFLREPKRINGFIGSCLNNRKVNLWTARRNREEAEPTLVVLAELNIPEWADPVALLESQELRDAVNRAIQRLPRIRRRIIALHYFRKKKRKEIAKLLGISLGSVAKHIELALAQLRQDLAAFAPGTEIREQA
jgi:RNA polymerase sigma factor (sigma-70 family)